MPALYPGWAALARVCRREGIQGAGGQLPDCQRKVTGMLGVIIGHAATD